MSVARIPRPRLAPGTITITFARPRSPPVVLGTWQARRNGILDTRGPPALAPELADCIEVQLALGRLHGLIRSDIAGVVWHWRYFADQGGA